MSVSRICSMSNLRFLSGTQFLGQQAVIPRNYSSASDRQTLCKQKHLTSKAGLSTDKWQTGNIHKHQIRWYSKDNQTSKEQRDLPSFGDEDFLAFPPFFRTIKNGFKVLFIKQFFDPEFSMQEFLVGSKHALEVVSNKLANGDFDGLKNLVDDATIDKMRKIVGPMTVTQRSEIACKHEDILVSVPGDIQFITEEDRTTEKSRFFVEITVVFHVIRNFQKYNDMNSMPQLLTMDYMKPETTKFRDLSIANYTFIKEFTKGVEDDWTINYIFHVKPCDETPFKRDS